MEIILKQDVKGLGYKYDQVKVKPGYARNYLIPQGFAIVATDSSKRMVAEIQKQTSRKAEKIKGDAQAIAANIGDIVLEIKAKAGESGKIFGAVTTLQISDALKAKGFDIDRKIISINEDVKNLGNYSAVIDLHREVKHTVRFSVVAE